MNILINSFASKMIERMFYHLNKNNSDINIGDISVIYSNVRCDHVYLGNVNITFVENIENIEEFIKEKNINMVITNVVHDYMLNNKDILVVTLNKCDNENIHFYRDIPVLINKYKLDNENNEISKIDDNDEIDNNDKIDENNKKEEFIENIVSSKNKEKTKITDSINILISNLSESALDKVINTIHSATINNNIMSDKFTVFSNIRINCDYFKVIFLDNLNINKKVCDFINEKNINIFITNYLDDEIINSVKDNCYIVSLIPLTKENTKIYFYKELSFIFNECKIQLKDKKPHINDIEIKNDIQIETNTNNVEKKTNGPKELFRDICLRYLDKFRKLKVPELSLNLKQEVVFVEYRNLQHLEVLLRNMIYNLGNSWSYTIVCGNKNYQLMETICNNIGNNIKIIKTNYDNLTQNEYNNFLYKTEFWDLFVGEKLFICQEDTCMFRKDIEQYLDYDYVGGAFYLDCVSPINVGNGGFSLRSKSIMKEVIKKMPGEQFKTNCMFSNHFIRMVKLDLSPEDNYFPQVMQDLNIGKVAPYDICKRFSSEQVYTENSLGMHCMWFSNKNWEKYIIDYFERINYNEKNIDIRIKQNIDVKTKKNIDVYILHCKDFTDREIKIKNAIKELEYQYNNYNIHMFEGINTSKHDLDLESQLKTLKEHDPNLDFDDPKKFKFYKGGQIGCYLGHHLIIKSIAENVNNTDYSIIFEDDIHLKDNFTQTILEIIEYFETIFETFDVIYLGHLNNNNGTVKYNNIYNLNKSNWNFGAHGLLINNKSAPKLYKYNCNILHEADNQYKLLYNNDLIKAFYLKEPIVFQDRSSFSYINLKKNNYN